MAQPTTAFDLFSCAYYAGLFDGEGSVIIRSVKPAARYMSLRVTLTISHQPTIASLKAIFGGSSTAPIRRGPGRPLYQWSITGTAAIAFLRAIRPWSVVTA